MRAAMLAMLLLAMGCCQQAAPLAAPTRLMVEYLHSPAYPRQGPATLAPLVSTAQPRLSFVPGQSELPTRGATISAYRIVVSRGDAEQAASPAWWDSGRVSSNDTTAVRCAKALPADSTWAWTAQYWDGGGQESPLAHGVFETGPIAPADWASSRWVGGGQGELRIRFVTLERVQRARLFVASPGGQTLSVNGVAVGDQTGVSSWMDYNKSLVYVGYDVTPADNQRAQVLELSIGRGFWAGPGVCRTKRRNANNLFQECGEHAVARLLLSLTLANGTKIHGMDSSLVQMEGRAGRSLMDDPYLGCTIDMASEDGAWQSLLPVADAAKPLLATEFGISALQVPAVRSVKVRPESVRGLRDGRYVYKFPTNIVGFVNIHDGSYSVRACGAEDAPQDAGIDCGNLTMDFCEVFNSSTGNCSTRQGYNSNQGHAHTAQWTVAERDTFLLRSGGSGALVPSFTWRGFMYCIVQASAGVQFRGGLADIHGVSILPGIERTGRIAFGGPGAATLSQLNEMVARTQAANLVGYYPSDCPTREKLGWLGDAMETAREEMYNYWMVPIHEHFIDIVRTMQGACAVNTSWSTATIAPCDPTYDDFVPTVVPAGFIADYGTRNGTGAENPGPQDVSWTAAFPLITGWLHEFYADEGVVRKQYAALKRWTDAQIKVAQMMSMPIPGFYNFGDHCSIAEQYQAHRSDPEMVTPYPYNNAEVTGPGSAAANFLIALEKMASLAALVGAEEDTRRYGSALATMRDAYDAEFYNETTSSYAAHPLNLQTLTSLALSAGATSGKHRSAAVASLVADVESRGHHLTVGSTGAPVLLQALTNNGHHDVAMRLALQESWPSWGFWLSGNATLGVGGGTCWESWLGDDTHNHIFLCGGLGEWMYSALGGIVPTGPGYRTLRIAPHISKTEGPSSLNASVQTIRGVVRSEWQRAGVESDSSFVVRLRVTVPIGSTADVSLPLLGSAATEVALFEGCSEADPQRGRRIWWAGAAVDEDAHAVVAVRAAIDMGQQGGEALVARVGAGVYSFCAVAM
eukprot:COSAG06_NODE_3038_length_5930_cov_14.172869_1_plen_1031_part_00